MMGNNCRCAEKVSRLQSLLGDLSLCELHAYGDSAGDTEMLQIALHPHFRAFEPDGELHESTRKDSSGKTSRITGAPTWRPFCSKLP